MLEKDKNPAAICFYPRAVVCTIALYIDCPSIALETALVTDCNRPADTSCDPESKSSQASLLGWSYSTSVVEM